jgi:repressor LexA
MAPERRPSKRRSASGASASSKAAASDPALVEEHVDDYIELPDVIGGQEGDYILQIRGESMKNAGIFEGDYVVVRPTDEVEDGTIVVAMIGEEATVKRIYRESDHIRLQPENDRMEPTQTTEAKVLGRVVGVIRKV